MSREVWLRFRENKTSHLKNALDYNLKIRSQLYMGMEKGTIGGQFWAEVKLNEGASFYFALLKNS